MKMFEHDPHLRVLVESVFMMLFVALIFISYLVMLYYSDKFLFSWDQDERGIYSLALI